jgi:hypothetical protein
MEKSTAQPEMKRCSTCKYWDPEGMPTDQGLCSYPAVQSIIARNDGYCKEGYSPVVGNQITNHAAMMIMFGLAVLVYGLIDNCVNGNRFTEYAIIGGLAFIIGLSFDWITREFRDAMEEFLDR